LPRGCRASLSCSPCFLRVATSMNRSRTEQGMKRSAWMVLALFVAVAGCSGSKSAQEASFAEIPQGQWNELVGQLTGAQDLDAAVAPTREILARGGIATRDGERELVAAHPPAASFSVSPGQVEHMALEARARGVRARLEVAEF